ncbi:MAG TPA: glycosyltransferase family 4 protein [Solirubrobacteraceae bacterium]
MPVSESRRPVVALVTDAVFPYHRGGKETRYHEIARRLADRAEVHVYTMRWWGEPPREGAVSYHALTPLVPLYSRERRSIRQALVFALGCLTLLVRRFDVIEADHMPYVQLFPLRLVATLRRKRLIVTWHEVWGPAYWRGYLGPLGRVGWWLERLAMRLPDVIIAASPETAERLRERLGDRATIAVAPNGVDLEEIRGAPPAPQRTDLVVVGRLLDHKRIDLLLDAVARLREAGVEASCRIIGDGPQREALHAQAERLGVADLVDFRHDVAGQRELYSLLKAGRVFVFPSAREGFGVAVLEALACGLPVVTTSAPDNLARHLVTRAADGIVCEPSAEAIAVSVQRVLAGSRRDGAPAWVSGFDWDSVTARVAEVVLA